MVQFDQGLLPIADSAWNGVRSMVTTHPAIGTFASQSWNDRTDLTVKNRSKISFSTTTYGI